MDDDILRKLLRTNNPAEKAAIAAEFFISQLSTEAAIAARQCIIFHWFDYSIVETLLQDTILTKVEKENVYQQLLSLPFTETLPWGHRFQILTREGLLRRYSFAQPELPRESARLAAPAYASHKDDKINIAESLFCYIVAGSQSVSISLLDELIASARLHEEWLYVGDLLRLQDEAERLPFVQPLPRTEEYWIIRGHVHSFQRKLDDAIADYGKALHLNPKSVPAYIGRGKIYTKQQKYKKALTDYNNAQQLDPTNFHIYTNRGALYTKQGQYLEALQDLDRALRIEPDNPFVLCNKGSVLTELGQSEEAVTVYDVALRVFPTMSEAYMGKGNALSNLQQYSESLVVYEEALRLDPYLADAHRGKGKALFSLKRYAEAQIAFEEATQLDFYSTNINDEEVEPASSDEQLERTHASKELIRDPSHTEDRQIQTNLTTNNRSITLLDRLKNVYRSNQRQKRRKAGQFGYFLGRAGALVAVALIIAAAALLFHSLGTTVGSNPNAIATAIAQSEATATAHAKLTTQLSVSPTSIDANTDCSFNNGWNCVVTLSTEVSDQGQLNWSASSKGISGITLSPPSGTLIAGQSTPISIMVPNIACPAAASITFSGQGSNSAIVSWGCSPTQLNVSPVSLNQTSSSCTQNTDGTYICTVTVSETPAGTLNWAASSSVSSISINPSSGQLTPHQSSKPVTLTSITCQNGTITFSGQGSNSVTVSWSCTPPTITVTANGTCPTNSNGNYVCTDTLTESGGPGTVNWTVAAESDLPGTSFNPSSGSLSPGQSIQVTTVIPGSDCPAGGHYDYTSPSNGVRVTFTCNSSSRSPKQLLSSSFILSFAPPISITAFTVFGRRARGGKQKRDV